jgi:hypothetical protein
MGLGELLPAERSALLSHIHDTLEIRVGEALLERMTDEQVSRLEATPPTLEDLQKIAPDCRKIVITTWAALRAEIEATVPQLLTVASKDPWHGGKEARFIDVRLQSR